MENFRIKILPFILGALTVAGFEAEIFYPAAYLYVLAGFFALGVIAAFFDQPVFSPKIFPQKIFFFFIFFSGIWAVLLYMESSFGRHLLALLGSAMMAARFHFLKDENRRPEIDFLFVVFAAFAVSAALFGLNLFFGESAVYLAVISFLPGIILCHELALGRGGEINYGIVVAGAVFWSELIFIMLMLPNSLYLGAAVAAIFIFIFGEVFYRKHFLPRAEIKLFIFSLVLFLLLFLTARWT